MKWYNDLYVSDDVAPKITKIIKKIEDGKILVGVYVITLSANKKDNLDIYQVNEFKQNYYKDKEMYIVGVSGSKKGCINLVKKIVYDCYKKNGDYNLRTFLSGGFN